ncbi:MAG: trypsin-like serine protease [Chloroflexi bacterium]|nr:trypsin-like serine protease [Chloroflexota bacterium]
MNKKVLLGLVGLLLISMFLCCAVAVVAVFYLRPSSDAISAVPVPEIVVATAAPALEETRPEPTLEKSSLPTLSSGKGDVTADSRPQSVDEADLSELYSQMEPGVVAIQTYVQQYGQLGESSGSGFIIDESGLVVTNEHVIADGIRIEVIFSDGSASRATVLGSDPDSDLALLQVEEMPEGARAVPLGDSDEVKPGQWVVAIGNPFGLQNTITYGIVSAVGRMIPARVGSYSIPQAIQTDAAINPGNSGGPLINMAGQVIGVNAQIYTDGRTAANAGVGFAIPVNIVRMVVPYLKEGNSYPWPWIGVSGTDVDMLLAEAGDLGIQRGAYIAEVTVGGPAARAGLRGSSGARQYGGVAIAVGGDVIIAANGQPINDFADLLETVAFSEAGDEIVLTVLREGKELVVTIALETRPAH